MGIFGWGWLHDEIASWKTIRDLAVNDEAKKYANDKIAELEAKNKKKK